MLGAVTPNITGSTVAPSVGIFWRVAGVLVVDRSTLDEAETYGDCITHAAGHYERWQEWQACLRGSAVRCESGQSGLEWRAPAA